MTKDLLLGAMDLSGAFGLFRLLHRDKAVIAMYHRFGTNDPDRTAPAVFAAQLEYLAAHYRVVPLSELVTRMGSGGAHCDRLAAVTIDDGYWDAYTHAWPVLRRLRIPATVFVTTGFIDRETWLWTDKVRYLLLTTTHAVCEVPHGGESRRFDLTTRESRLAAAAHVNELLKRTSDEHKEWIIAALSEALDVSIPTAPPADFEPLSWSEVAELDSAGLEIGAHTVTHPILTRTTAYRLRHEVWDCRLRLQDALRHSVRLFCYPNGAHDETVRREVRLAGYTAAVTVETGLNDWRTDPFALRRIHTAPDLAHFAQSSCGFEQLKLSVYRRLGRESAAVA